MRHVAQALQRLRERCESVVVPAVRVFSLTPETREIIGRNGSCEHQQVGSGDFNDYRPTTPSTGLLAEAYLLRGIRPERYPSRPASTANRIAVAMPTGD